MTKRITHLDVLGEARRARRILTRIIRYLEQEERRERRAGAQRARTYTATHDRDGNIDYEVGEQG